MLNKRHFFVSANQLEVVPLVFLLYTLSSVLQNSSPASGAGVALQQLSCLNQMYFQFFTHRSGVLAQGVDRRRMFA
jgi:hypothetical protein